MFKYIIANIQIEVEEKNLLEPIWNIFSNKNKKEDTECLYVMYRQRVGDYYGIEIFEIHKAVEYISRIGSDIMILGDNYKKAIILDINNIYNIKTFLLQFIRKVSDSEQTQKEQF